MKTEYCGVLKYKMSGEIFENMVNILGILMREEGEPTFF